MRLQQIMSNLLGNAVKYTPAGGSIHVYVKREGADAVLRVRDTGIGISPALAPRMFELFVQGDPGMRSGLGVGLAVVRRLVELHGGTVQASSDGLERAARSPWFCRVFLHRPHDGNTVARPAANVTRSPRAGPDSSA
jgi:two-component system CheB/CheR fusion protein